MKTYNFSKFCITGLALSTYAFSAQKPARPNVIVILSDDMGYSDLGCFGSEIKTPNIDRLAANGLRFTQFYNTPRSSPTRASLLTGLYPHQAGMGHLATQTYSQAGYYNDLSKNAVTMAEVFKNSGYSTYMTGKWHIAKNILPQGDRSNWPLNRGFERFFGTLTGAGSFYDPGAMMSNNTFIAPTKDFYYTDAISDSTVKFIREHKAEKPFFFYVAYTAAHWPLHAPEHKIQKYKNGWDSIRYQRFRKLKSLGIIRNDAVLTERAVKIPAWENEPLKEWQQRRMQVYAAMIDVMDQGIGRIIDALDKKGELENTLIFFMQDNGACAEEIETNYLVKELTSEQKILKPMKADSVFMEKKPDYTRDGIFIRGGRGLMPGAADTWLSYGEEWANVSNTPYRMYKHWTHEGGIATPLIAYWPLGIKQKGELRKQPSNIIDIMATCVDICGLNYPTNYNNNKISPYEGVSLKPAFSNKKLNREFIFWEHESNRALRMGKWKLVSKTKKMMQFTAEDNKNWELYNLENDPTETKNLAELYPKQVEKMKTIWEKEALRIMAKPWPWDKE